MKLEGIHHITAITGDAAGNVDFYARVLGLRLIAKTVNQDDPSVYHLFYGDEAGQPGSELTFFEYPGAASGHAGPGMVHRIVWRLASTDALEFWHKRLEGEGVVTERAGSSLLFADPEGLRHELAVSASPDAPLSAAHPEIASDLAIQGFDGVHAYSANHQATARLLEDLLGAEARAEAVWELRGERRGGWIAYDQAAASRAGRPGAGTVHHIAWHTTDADQGRWAELLTQARVPNSGIIDRHYFHSLYFREPGGVLYELATTEPGFAVDGPIDELNRQVILPPWLEPYREQIEGRLTPLPEPRADRVAGR